MHCVSVAVRPVLQRNEEDGVGEVRGDTALVDQRMCLLDNDSSSVTEAGDAQSGRL